jgi:electron transfer flavoprotein beta subunit
MPHAFVCVKPIPDPKEWDRLSLDPKTGVLKRAGISTVINSLDKNALEAALQLKDRFGWTVTVVSMAPPDAEKTLREALAMGADNVLMASDRALGGADTLATAYALAALVRRSGEANMVFCGNMSLDGSTNQVVPQLAEFLDLPHASHVVGIETEDGSTFEITVDLKDALLTLKHQGPMVLGLTKEANDPRLVSVMGIIAAQSKSIEVFSADDLELDPEKIGQKGSPTMVSGLFMPEIKRRREILRGDLEEVVERLVDGLRETGAL